MCVDSTDRDVRRSRRRLFVLRREVDAFVLRRDETLLAREVGKTEVLVETAEVMEKMVEKTTADPMSSLKAMQANMEAKRFADETRRGYY